MFLLNIFKGIGKRLIRDLLRYGSVWLVIVIILFIHFSGILKLNFIDNLLKGDTAIEQLGKSLTDANFYTDDNSIKDKQAVDTQTYQLDDLVVDEKNSVDIKDDNTALSTPIDNTKEDIFLIYENGKYHPYNE